MAAGDIPLRRVDSRPFVRFHVDVGIGYVIVEPIETMAARDWLAFAEIAPPSVPMIAREQQFAEKIHAYTLPRTNPNCPVRDLVDLYLLTASGTLDRVRCADARRRTFDRRATHEVPTELTLPPPVRSLTTANSKSSVRQRSRLWNASGRGLCDRHVIQGRFEVAPSVVLEHSGSLFSTD
ncbi:MAG: nucleotidyl transferase AbiEii/AbiGii toxin family protein [Acidobacteria bacterium]|nr:nucleotidyl transferase AbiEii/AbiGii toxin family protein [Acidobacteriota bacterium]